MTTPALPDTLAAHVAAGLTERQREARIVMSAIAKSIALPRGEQWTAIALLVPRAPLQWAFTPFGVRVRALVAKEAGDA